MKVLYGALWVAAGAAGVLAIVDPVSGQDKADKKPEIVQVDLNKLPPEVAKRLLDEVSKAADDGKKADKGKGAGEKKPEKGKGSDKPSKGKKPDKGKPGEKPSGGKKPVTPGKGKDAEK